jgi:Tol biopolymer transport system component
MNDHRRSGALLIVIICLVTIPLVITAEPVSGTETVLFTLSGEPFTMILNEDRLFWIQDSKYLNGSERGLYGYNLTDGTKRQLVRIGEQTQMSSDGTIPTLHQVETAGFSGDRVVFSEKGIILMNISTGSLVQLTNQNDAVLPVSDLRFNQNPSIDGDRVVWTEHEGLAHSSVDGGTIVILNLTTGERQYLPTGSPGNQSTPMISGNYILWKDYRHGGPNDPELYLFDLKNGEEERLPTENPLKSNPFISGDDVVWTEKTPGMIVHYAISSRTRTVVGQGSVHQGHLPPVSDDRVVWLQSMNPLDFRERRCAIMVMDLRTGEKSRITPFRTGLSHPVISGDRVIFTRGAGEDWSREPREVVLYTLTARDEETVSGTDTRPGNGLPPTPATNSLDKNEAIPPTSSPGFTCFTLIAGCAATLASRKVWRIYTIRK